MKTKLFSLFLFCLVSSSINAARIVDGINYEFDREEMVAFVEPLSYPNEYSGDIVIPEKVVVGDYVFDVKAIDKEAFSGSDITSITFPKSLVVIGTSAFESCTKLKSISLPDSVRLIGNYAFYNCRNVTNLRLPNNDVIMLDMAFAYMQSLEELVIPDKWTHLGYEDCDEFFSGCTSLRKVVIGKGVKVIYDYAFYECESLEEVVCYDDGSLETIHEGVFEKTAISSMRFLPKTLKSLAGNAFYECDRLTEAFIPASVEEYGYAEYHHNCKKLVLEDSETPLNITTWSGHYAEEIYLGRQCTGIDLPYTTNNDKYIKKVSFGPKFKGDNKWKFGSAVTEIYSYVENPSDLTFTFNQNVYDNAKLYVPKGRKKAYMAQSNFEQFFEIYEMEGASSGDINKDSEVNVTDVVTLINYIAKDDFSDVDKNTLDVNGDGKVDVTDVVTLILMIGQGN